MIIKQIELCNFGPYKGKIVFDTYVDEKKNMVVFGGKNGAGKTTLFMAMLLCLYGHIGMGYKVSNKKYEDVVQNYLNNSAKIDGRNEFYAKMIVLINNGNDLDEYSLKRSWSLTTSFKETFEVIENGKVLGNEDILNFVNLLYSLVPPDSFSLFFFDGEKIVDSFFGNSGHLELKNVFLKLCRYDIFDIMERNFKRISSDVQVSNTMQEYLECETRLQLLNSELEERRNCLSKSKNELENIELNVKKLDKDFSNHGGVTEKELAKKIVKLKDEERVREAYNIQIKRWINDIIPFLMVKDKLIELRKLLSLEVDNSDYKGFLKVINHRSVTANFDVEILNELKARAKKLFASEGKSILDLSMEQNFIVSTQIKSLLEFDVTQIALYKENIKKSLKKTNTLRKKIKESSNALEKDYLKRRSELLEKKNVLLTDVSATEKIVAKLENDKSIAESTYFKSKKLLEIELKKNSINDIAAKAILMLQELQEKLYSKQIEKIEKRFLSLIKTILSKKSFVEDIVIDKNFNIHLYRHTNITVGHIQDLLGDGKDVNALTKEFGVKCIDELRETYGTNFDVQIFKIGNRENRINVLTEIKKESISSGEKQIFVMALYYSLLSLCRHTIPFIIDTPFARVDAEHRANLVKNFFIKLPGQVFIFSTDEEISDFHMDLMSKQLACKYLLENNGDNTIVHSGVYFGGMNK